MQTYPSVLKCIRFGEYTFPSAFFLILVHLSIHFEGILHMLKMEISTFLLQLKIKFSIFSANIIGERGIKITNLTSLVAQLVKSLLAMLETWVWTLVWENPLEEGMATHSGILAWRIPMDRGVCQSVFCGVMRSWTQLSDYAYHKWGKGILRHSLVLNIWKA